VFATLLSGANGRAYQLSVTASSTLAAPPRNSRITSSLVASLNCHLISGHTVLPGGVICVQVVLHNVLVDPVDRGSSDVVLTEAEEAVHPRVAAHGAVVRIMLDVKT
jgi:hypothetical protein